MCLLSQCRQPLGCLIVLQPLLAVPATIGQVQKLPWDMHMSLLHEDDSVYMHERVDASLLA